MSTLTLDNVVNYLWPKTVVIVRERFPNLHDDSRINKDLQNHLADCAIREVAATRCLYGDEARTKDFKANTAPAWLFQLMTKRPSLDQMYLAHRNYSELQVDEVENLRLMISLAEGVVDEFETLSRIKQYHESPGFLSVKGRILSLNYREEANKLKELTAPRIHERRIQQANEAGLEIWEPINPNEKFWFENHSDLAEQGVVRGNVKDKRDEVSITKIQNFCDLPQSLQFVYTILAQSALIPAFECAFQRACRLPRDVFLNDPIIVDAISLATKQNLFSELGLPPKTRLLFEHVGIDWTMGLNKDKVDELCKTSAQIAADIVREYVNLLRLEGYFIPEVI